MDQDAVLVERCLQGGDSAWEQLVRTHTRLVYGVCYRFTGRPEDARDLTQEVFLRVYRSLHTFNPASGAFRTWLIRLTRNLLIDDYRKMRKHQFLDPLDEQIERLEQAGGSGARADQGLTGRETEEALRAGLGKLSPELREAVVLRDLNEMEYREIALVLAVPEGTVKSRINRGRRELARHLRAAGVTP
jgi:RNA polymerase sigma-70 factor (ECF subfamily)